MMINDDNECLTDAVTIKSKTISSHENNPSMSSNVCLSNNTGEEHSSVQNENNNDQNNDFSENESQDKQALVVQQDQNGKEDEEEVEPQQGGDNDDEFIRITAAHQMLTEAQTYEEQKNIPAALHLYRICVDLLLEELMFAEGTDQSRVYLREKCTAVMDRVDLLKTKLDPIPPSAIEPIEPSATPAIEPSPTPIEPTTAASEQTTTATIEQAITTPPITSEEATNPPTEELNSIHLS